MQAVLGPSLTVAATKPNPNPSTRKRSAPRGGQCGQRMAACGNADDVGFVDARSFLPIHDQLNTIADDVSLCAGMCGPLGSAIISILVDAHTPDAGNEAFLPGTQVAAGCQVVCPQTRLGLTGPLPSPCRTFSLPGKPPLTIPVRVAAHSQPASDACAHSSLDSVEVSAACLRPHAALQGAAAWPPFTNRRSDADPRRSQRFNGSTGHAPQHHPAAVRAGDGPQSGPGGGCRIRHGADQGAQHDAPNLQSLERGEWRGHSRTTFRTLECGGAAHIAVHRQAQRMFFVQPRAKKPVRYSATKNSVSERLLTSQCLSKDARSRHTFLRCRMVIPAELFRCSWPASTLSSRHRPCYAACSINSAEHFARASDNSIAVLRASDAHRPSERFAQSSNNPILPEHRAIPRGSIRLASNATWKGCSVRSSRTSEHPANSESCRLTLHSARVRSQWPSAHAAGP